MRAAARALGGEESGEALASIAPAVREEGKAAALRLEFDAAGAPHRRDPTQRFSNAGRDPGFVLLQRTLQVEQAPWAAAAGHGCLAVRCCSTVPLLRTSVWMSTFPRSN